MRAIIFSSLSGEKSRKLKICVQELVEFVFAGKKRAQADTRQRQNSHQDGVSDIDACT
jgi:hypothetical protein